MRSGGSFGGDNGLDTDGAFCISHVQAQFTEGGASLGKVQPYLQFKAQGGNTVALPLVADSDGNAVPADPSDSVLLGSSGGSSLKVVAKEHKMLLPDKSIATCEVIPPVSPEARTKTVQLEDEDGDAVGQITMHIEAVARAIEPVQSCDSAVVACDAAEAECRSSGQGRRNIGSTTVIAGGPLMLPDAMGMAFGSPGAIAGAVTGASAVPYCNYA